MNLSDDFSDTKTKVLCSRLFPSHEAALQTIDLDGLILLMFLRYEACKVRALRMVAWDSEKWLLEGGQLG